MPCPLGRRTLTLLSVLLTAHVAFSQVAANESEARLPKRHRLEVTAESFRDALQRYVADHGMSLIVIGEAGTPVTVLAEAPNIDDVIRAAAARAGYLAIRDGDVWTLYGTGAEHELSGREVLYTHKLQATTAERAVEQVSKLGLSGVHVAAVRELNGVFIRGELSAVRKTVEMLNSVDIEAPTIYVELLLVEYSHGKRFEWRFDVTNATYGRISDGTYGAGLLAGAYHFVTQIKQPFKFNLRALVTDDLARVITNPHIAVQNGNPATIRFDQEEHIVLTPPPANNAVVSSKVEVITAPIELTITPVATGDGTIHLDVSGIVAFFVEGQGEFSIDRHTVKSRVAIRDGQTLILGGLVKESRMEIDAGVPFLRRLPLVGYLFKDHDARNQFTEIVIYVTPSLNNERSFDPDAGELEIRKRLDDIEQRRRGHKPR